MNRPRDFRPAADSPPGRVSRDPSPIWTVQREPRIERWQRQRLPSGRKTPFIGERTERRPFPGNPTRTTLAEPEPLSQIAANVVATNPSSRVDRPGWSSREPRLNPRTRWDRRPTTENGTGVPPRNTVPMRKQAGNRNRRNSLEKGRQRWPQPPSPHPLPIPRDPPDWDHPCAPRPTVPTEGVGGVDSGVAIDTGKYLDTAGRCQAAPRHGPPLSGPRRLRRRRLKSDGAIWETGRRPQRSNREKRRNSSDRNDR